MRGMDKKSVRKYIYWGIFILFVVGSMATGSPFNFIDMIVVRPIVNILFVIFNLVHDFGLAMMMSLMLCPSGAYQIRALKMKSL